MRPAELSQAMQTDPAFTKQIASRIRTLRKESGVTQAQLAERMELSQAAVARYETGSRQIPIAMLPAFAKALELVSIDQIFGFDSLAAKRGPTPKLVKRFNEIRRLPKKDQDFVLRLIDTTLREAQAS